jgi:hypothetical protein
MIDFCDSKDVFSAFRRMCLQKCAWLRRPL